MRSFVAFIAGFLLAFAAEAATFVRMQSLPGDPSGAGVQRIEHGDASVFSFTVKPNAAGGVDFVRVAPCNPICYPTADFTEVRFAPAAGQAFGVGTYSNAQIYSPTPASRPGLLADEAGRAVGACPTITGSFTVLEIQRAADGRITRFAADFEQHCRGQAPALYGSVRFESDVPYVQPVPYAPGAVRYTSEPGDLVGPGTAGAFEVSDGRTASTGSVPAQVRLQLMAPDDSTRWDVLFASGSAAPLQVGVYPGAGMTATPAGQPVLLVKNGANTCASYAEAAFEVFEIAFSPVGVLERFAADLHIRCTGATGALHAGVRYNSIVPYAPANSTVATGNTAGGGVMSIAIAPNSSSCAFGSMAFLHPTLGTFPIPAPQMVAFPYGAISFRTDNCTPTQTFDVDFPSDLPPTAQWWVYGPTADNLSLHWYVIPAQINGRRISFTINDAEKGDADLRRNGSISSLGMLVIPNGPYQDLWWAGLAENGWGLSLIQHRDVLFANLFVYDANGAAVWYVMPGGSWDGLHRTYSGAVYLPHGSPYFAYDVSRFNIGSAVGTMRLAFDGTNNAVFEYTINGVSARKDLTRIAFGPQTPPLDQMLGDLWWGGPSQNGWGIALLQQYTALFGVWYTYDGSGNPTWFVMPQGDWAFANDYRGKIYRPVGPPWLGVPYDVSRHRTVEAGTFRYRFSSDGAIFDWTLDGRSGSMPVTRLPF
jgi:hypothetical protein